LEIEEDNWYLNKEIYHSKKKTTIEVKSIHNITFAKKYEEIGQQHPDIYCVANAVVFRYSEALIFDNKFDPVPANQCLTHLHPSSQTAEMPISLENVKVTLHNMFVKADASSQGDFGYALKKIYIGNWCW
jgi:hypothetical protein